MKELVLQLLPLGHRQTGGRTQDLGIGWVAHGGLFSEGHGVALLSSQPPTRAELVPCVWG